MKPLRVTAHLSTPIAVMDNYSPSLESLIEFLILDRAGRASPNPTPEEVEQTRPFVFANMPIQRGDLNGEWYWQASAPHYLYEWEVQIPLRKRWDNQDRHLNWNGKRRNWSTAEGHTKSWTVLLNKRFTAQIDWFCVGDRTELSTLLTYCSNLTKKRCGQVTDWQIQPWEDWHLWGANGQLMKPIPLSCLPSNRAIDFHIQEWGWRPPSFIIENMTHCGMPTSNVTKVPQLMD